MSTRLFHFSEDGHIDHFIPRPALVPSKRAAGMEWLNGPLVWAIDDWHQPMYLFPRDCPRILLWKKECTTDQDAQTYIGSSTARIIAHVEKGWFEKIQSATLHRYELPTTGFESLHDAGMWVSKERAIPIEKNQIRDLPSRLENEGVELRALDDLSPLRNAWKTTLHVSGIRLRNARNWL